jgi:hypothetical protein
VINTARQSCTMPAKARVSPPKLRRSAATSPNTIAADGTGECAPAGRLQPSDFAEVERAWIKALREVGVSVRSSAVA